MRRVYLDKLGRIVIPISIRRALSINEGSALDITFEKGKIIISNPAAYCKLCNYIIDNDLGVGLCNKCIEKIKKL